MLHWFERLKEAKKKFSERISRGNSPEEELSPETSFAEELHRAATAFVTRAKSIDRDLMRIYGFMSQAKVPFTRLVNIQTFIDLDNAVKSVFDAPYTNSKRTAYEEVADEVVQKAKKLDAIMSDPRSNVIRAPFEFAKKSGLPDKWPELHGALLNFMGLVEIYNQTRLLDNMFAGIKPGAQPIP